MLPFRSARHNDSCAKKASDPDTPCVGSTAVKKHSSRMLHLRNQNTSCSAETTARKLHMRRSCRPEGSTKLAGCFGCLRFAGFRERDQGGSGCQGGIPESWHSRTTQPRTATTGCKRIACHTFFSPENRCLFLKLAWPRTVKPNCEIQQLGADSPPCVERGVLEYFGKNGGNLGDDGWGR